MKRATSLFLAHALSCLLLTLLATGSARADQGALEWSFSTTGGARCGMAISPNGTLYTGTDQAYFYAITPSGALEKSIDLPNTIRYATPAISSNGTIYIGNGNGYFYAFSPDLSPQWYYNSGSAIEASPAISSNGTIYILNNGGEFHALYPDKTVWVSIDTGTGQFSRSGVSISQNGTCYFADNSGVIYSWTPGASSVTTLLSTGSTSTGTIALSSNGTLYVPVGSELWAVSPAGTKLWAYSAGGTVLSPAISDNGTIYVTNYGSTIARAKSVHAVNPDGTAQWTYGPYEHFGTGVDYQVLNGPTLSANGTIYFPISGQVCALSPAGSLKWCYNTGSTSDITQPVALAPNGTLYFGSADSKIFAVTGDGYGLAYSAWPNYRHDSYGTGRSQPFWTLPDTGQTKCYNAAGDEISCPASGAAFYGQDAQYNGSQPHFELYVDNTVGNVTKDLNTNLMWQYKGGAKMSSADSEPYCKNLAYGGYTDWRLPTAYESRTILNYNSSNLCYSSFVCNSSYYWTGSRNSRSTARRYYINLNYGGSLGATAFGSYFVRCVRGQLNSPSYLAANGSKIVKDASTGLVWQRDGSTAGAITWENSLSYCENLDLAGKTDWRLPNVMELISIADFNNASLAVSSQFTNMHGNSYYWTSTTAPNAAQALSNKAMAVAFSNMGTGYASIGVDAFLKTSTTTYTLCVRDGSADSPDRTATLTGAPSGTTTATTATITVGGTGITAYRYKLDSGNFSDVIGTTAKIHLTGLSKAAHTVSVLGISQEGKLQANPTTATWTVGSGGGGGSNSTNSSSKTNVIQTKDGTNPHTDPNAADADTGITFPSYQTSQYDSTVDAELNRLGFGAMTRNLTTYEGWQSSVTDSTALTYLKSNDSTDIATGLNLLSTNGTVDRVLTGMINATSTTTNLGYALFIRNTTNLAKTYYIDDTRYAKVMGNTVTLFTMALAPFGSSVTSDLYAYLRTPDGSVVTDTFTGEASACVWIKDNGAYDADPTPGSVSDPGYVSTLETSEATDTSSSTGCMMNPRAGMKPELLLLLTAPVLWLVRRRKTN